MASKEELNFNAPHPPHPKAIEAFNVVLPTIKHEIKKSRHEWDKHEPKMWSRAHGVSNEDLTAFTIESDLVLVRSATTSYGTIILGKIRIPKLKPEGYIHVRIDDPGNRGEEDVIFHSLLTEEGNKDADEQLRTWNAIQDADTPLEFFNE